MQKTWMFLVDNSYYWGAVLHEAVAQYSNYTTAYKVNFILTTKQKLNNSNTKNNIKYKKTQVRTRVSHSGLVSKLEAAS